MKNLLGALVIIFAILIFSSLYYYGFKSDASYDNWSVYTKNYLNRTYIYLEYYKTQNNNYPDSLSMLKQYDNFLVITDTPNQNDFYYKKMSDSTYYLLGIGKDKIPFTKDDFYPSLADENPNRNGLLKK